MFDIPSKIEAQLKPDFFAIHTPPGEMQAVVGFGKNSAERKQAYFDWAAKVVAGLRGVHPGAGAGV